MNDTVILTFTYPLIEPYFEDFLKSCETQTNKEFDIIIVNDGLTSLPVSYTHLTLPTT